MSSNPNISKQFAKTNKKTDSNSKGIELFIVNAWQYEVWWLWLLLPFSWLYGAIISVRKSIYRAGLLSPYQAPVPVMIVGNITVGGSGKTPLIIELVRFLQRKNINVGVISRGYGGNEALMPSLVKPSSKPSDVGDEPCLIVGETRVAMSVSPDRQQAIECLLAAYPNIQLIIADDGLQHYKLERDIEWIVVDSDRGFGNKQLLPAGYLREPLTRLSGATVIYHETLSDTPSVDKINTSLDRIPEQTRKPLIMTLAPDLPRLLNSEKYDSQSSSDRVCLNSNNYPTVYGVSGIGYPQRFFKTLRTLGFTVVEYPKPDHHEFHPNDLIHLMLYPIVITSKDAVKIAPLIEKHPNLKSLPIWVLPVKAVLTEKCYTTLLEQLSHYGVVGK